MTSTLRQARPLLLCAVLFGLGCPSSSAMPADAAVDASATVDVGTQDDAGATADGGVTADAGAAVDGGATADQGPAGAQCDGYATRYWDCCKAHCGWTGNVPSSTTPVTSCGQNGAPLTGDFLEPSSCPDPGQGGAYTCFDMAPWQVDSTLAYGFAAVPSSGDICGRCYELEFTGTGHYDASDPGSAALAGKRMIVQATNIGFDVAGGQFDVLIPGGGVGAFDACTQQWGIDSEPAGILGAQYGGFLTACQEAGGGHENIKQCVLSRCTEVFDEAHMGDLLAGCQWFVGWYEAADNPNLRYREVACPAAILTVSGMDRGAVGTTDCGSGSCTQADMDACDCSWTNGGASCGADDGSCCWMACCGS